MICFFFNEFFFNLVAYVIFKLWDIFFSKFVFIYDLLGRIMFKVWMSIGIFMWINLFGCGLK